MEGTKYLVDATLALAPLYRSSTGTNSSGNINNKYGAQQQQQQQRNLTQEGEPSSSARESKSPVDALGSCCHNVSSAMEAFCDPDGMTATTTDAWFQLWLLSLSGLTF